MVPCSDRKPGEMRLKEEDAGKRMRLRGEICNDNPMPCRNKLSEVLVH